MVRTREGIKETPDDDLVCYCYGETKADAKSKEAKEFMIERAKNGGLLLFDDEPIRSLLFS